VGIINTLNNGNYQLVNKTALERSDRTTGTTKSRLLMEVSMQKTKAHRKSKIKSQNMVQQVQTLDQI
jgi:hypothetical protein